MTYRIYHETLGGALDTAVQHAQHCGASLEESEKARLLGNVGPVNYGETRALHFPIDTLNERATRKFFHVLLYRMECGRYELTSYIL